MLATDKRNDISLRVQQEHGLTLVRWLRGALLGRPGSRASGSKCPPSTDGTAREKPGWSVCFAPGSCPLPAAYTSGSVPNPPAAPAQTRCIRRGFGALAASVPGAGPDCL